MWWIVSGLCSPDRPAPFFLIVLLTSFMGHGQAMEHWLEGIMGQTLGQRKEGLNFILICKNGLQDFIH